MAADSKEERKTMRKLPGPGLALIEMLDTSTTYEFLQADRDELIGTMDELPLETFISSRTMDTMTKTLAAHGSELRHVPADLSLGDAFQQGLATTDFVKARKYDRSGITYKPIRDLNYWDMDKLSDLPGVRLKGVREANLLRFVISSTEGFKEFGRSPRTVDGQFLQDLLPARTSQMSLDFG